MFKTRLCPEETGLHGASVFVSYQWLSVGVNIKKHNRINKTKQNKSLEPLLKNKEKQNPGVMRNS